MFGSHKPPQRRQRRPRDDWPTNPPIGNDHRGREVTSPRATEPTESFCASACSGCSSYSYSVRQDGTRTRFGSLDRTTASWSPHLSTLEFRDEWCIKDRGGKMRYSVPVRSVGQSRCRYRRRALEYEGILFRHGQNYNLPIESGQSAARCCILASGIP